MSTRPAITTITSGYSSVEAINTNFDKVADAIEGLVARAGGTNNTLLGTLDVNGQRLINLPAPADAGDPARLQDVLNAISPNPVPANLTSFSPFGHIAATTVQGAIQEIYTDMALGTGAADIGYTRPETSAALRTLAARESETLFMNDFTGVDPTGASDSTAGGNAAIAAAVQLAATTGKHYDIVCNGTYLLTGTVGSDSVRKGWHIPYTNADDITPRVRLIGRAYIKANSDNMELLRISDSHSGFHGRFVFFGNGHTGVEAFTIKPNSVTDTATTSHQVYNICMGYYIANCTEGIVMQSGPHTGADVPGGVDSVNAYNYCFGFIYNTTRGFWLKNGVGTLSPLRATGQCNRNTIDGVIGHGVANTGGWIDSGAQTKILCHFEGISSGTSPSSTPTALHIANQDGFGRDNNYTIVDNVAFESNTRDLNNLNPRTRIRGGFINATKWAGVAPQYVSESEPSFAPLITPWMEYGEGVAGYPSGYVGLKKDLADVGYPWTTDSYAIGDFTNVATLVSVTSKSHCNSHEAHQVIKFVFVASVAGTEIVLKSAIPHDSMYDATLSRMPLYATYVWNGATSLITEVGFVDGQTKFYVVAPAGGWSTSGNNVVTLNVHWKRS